MTYKIFAIENDSLIELDTASKPSEAIGKARQVWRDLGFCVEVWRDELRFYHCNPSTVRDDGKNHGSLF
jgi:hypothetical protein